MEVRAVNKGPIIGVALVAAAAVVLLAGVPISRLLTLLLVLACPLMMVFMHRGGHGGHRSHDAEHTEAGDDLHTAKH